MLDEFDLISTFFQQVPQRKDVIKGVGDDCAILQPPSHRPLLVSTDTLNENIHFFSTASPFDVGYKSVAVSLSDMAAMGGEPAWLLLAITLPSIDETWLTAFSQGLFACLNTFNVDLVGGNTTKGPLAITTQILGFGVNSVLTRSNAQPGDHIFVTSTLGDAALALAVLSGKQSHHAFNPEELQRAMQRFSRPFPRIKEGCLLNSIANAAIDLSDGLQADLTHLLTASQVGATLYYEKLPVSNLLKTLDLNSQYNYVLAGGEDYELCFTVSIENLPLLVKKQAELPGITHIGYIEQRPGLRIVDPQGNPIILAHKGFQHFS